MDEPLRAGVIGVGYLGTFHARKYAALAETELVAVADTDLERAGQVAADLGARPYGDFRALLPEVDLISIAVPTQDHFAIARECMEAGRHVLVEKPLAASPAQARELVSIARRQNVVLQVGHLERFNPAVCALRPRIHQPVFIESHRLAPFKPRSTDVDVVLDLMIHDIDIVLTLVPSEIAHVHAVGVPVLTNHIDIANARLVFENGCVANVTASRASHTTLRKLRIFQADQYFSLDYNERRLTCYGRPSRTGVHPDLPAESLQFDQRDVLLEEIRSFVRSVQWGEPPVVSGIDGQRALELASVVSRAIRKSRSSGERSPAAAHRPIPNLRLISAQPD